MIRPEPFLSATWPQEPGMLHYLRLTRTLRFLKAGSLNPWLGPSLRGLFAQPFKESVCVHAPAEQQTLWRYCQGCPRMAGCPYGETLEPDPPAEARVFVGQEQATRPLVVHPAFPAPARVRPGDELPLSVVFLGERAMGHAPRVWEALSRAGLQRGFDPEGTTFEVGDGGDAEGPVAIELPLLAPADEGVLARVRVELTGPLVLRGRDERGRRHHLECPSLADLLRACLRTLGSLHTLYDRPLPAAFAELKALAECVPLLRSDYRPFYQHRWSNRGGQGRPAHGVMGWAEYGPVPSSLVPWLEWGGRVHVGIDRVAGAGGWRVTTVDAER